MEKKELKESYNYIQKLLDGSNADNQHYDCLDKIYTMAIAKLKDNDGWISVKESLPKCDGKYFVNVNSYGVHFDHYSGKKWFEYANYVTHWMPLPPPPKGE